MIEFEPMLPEHWGEVRAIYEEGLATGNASFETNPPSWETWDKSHLAQSRLVAKEGDLILGWAALSPVSGRCVYAGVAEVSVYVSKQARGKGLGKRLLKALVNASEKNELWTLQAGIFPENTASVQIHLDNGFRIVGTREKIGKLNDTWRDTLLLERRSKLLGT